MRNFGLFVKELHEDKLTSQNKYKPEIIGLQLAAKNLLIAGEELMGKDIGELEVEIHRKIDGQPEFKLKEK